jgi:hypothetical protein
MMTLASRRLRNHSIDRHSSVNFPLKLSLVQFCQGLPGSISTVSNFLSIAHCSGYVLTNPGPLTLRRYFGAPCRLINRLRTSMTRLARMLAATSIAEHSRGSSSTTLATICWCSTSPKGFSLCQTKVPTNKPA